MNDASIQQVSPNNTALNAEHYQSFEMAKANDDVLANGTLKELINYQAQVRAMLEYTHKLVSTMSSWDEFTSSRAETLATEQAAANLNVFIDQRMGELVAALPTKQGKRSDLTSLPVGNKVTKTEALQDAGLTPKTASQLEQLAKNHEVVEAVIAKAEQDGRVVSRSQVLKAIKERDKAREDLEDAYMSNEVLEREIDNLKQKVSERPEPKVIEREVEVVREVVPEETKRRVSELEHLERIHCDDNQKLRRQLEETRKKLDRAKVLLEEKGYEDNASWDISTLTSAINQLLRTYGGKVWAFDQFYRVDEVTQQEFVKAITNLAAFSQSIVQYISDNNKLEV